MTVLDNFPASLIEGRAPRERGGLFDIVRFSDEPQCGMRSPVLILRSARAEEMPQSTNARARVSKDEGGNGAESSCFETHRSAAESVTYCSLALRCSSA